MSLFNAIRATRLAYLQKKHPTLHEDDVRRLFSSVSLALACHPCSFNTSFLAVATSNNQAVPEGGLHGENRANSRSTMCSENAFQNAVESVDFCVFLYFQQREPFKKRWFTLCSVNRKLIYYKTPLVNHNRYIGNGCIEYIVLNQMQG